MDQIKILREAFTKTMSDRGFLAQAKKGRVDIEPSRGEDLQLLAKKVMEQPPEVIERIKKLFVQ